MDNAQMSDEGLNLDEWEQIHSPALNTVVPTRNPSREWDMVAIRDHYLRDSLSFFPPSEHEDLSINKQEEEPKNSPSPSSPISSSSSNGLATANNSSSSDLTRRRFKILSSGIVGIAAKLRYYVVYIGGFSSFASVTGVAAAVLLSLLYAKVKKWRRRVQEENSRLILLIKEKDQKIKQLMLQIAHMKELLLAPRKVPVLRIG